MLPLIIIHVSAFSDAIIVQGGIVHQQFPANTKHLYNSSKSFIKVSLLFHKDHSEFELRETHTKIFKTYIKT